MKTWDDHSTDEKFLALVNEVQSLRRRCDDQAVLIGEQRRAIEQTQEVVSRICESLMGYKYCLDQININALAVNGALMESGMMKLDQYRKHISRATHVHDQFTAIMRDEESNDEQVD